VLPCAGIGAAKPWQGAMKGYAAGVPTTGCKRSAVVRGSMTQPEVLDQGAVAVHVGPLEVFEQAPPAPHHLEEAPAAVVVVLVSVEVAAKVVDSRGEQRHLHLRTACPVLVGLVLPYDLLFVDSHACFRVLYCVARIVAGRTAI